MAANRDNVFYSGGILSLEDKFNIFQSADIGLMSFTSRCSSPLQLANIKYAAQSAGTLYDFMRCGILMLGNAIPGMREMLEDTGCDLVVPDASVLPRILPQIMKKYDFFTDDYLYSFLKYEFSSSYTHTLRMTERMCADKQR